MTNIPPQASNFKKQNNIHNGNDPFNYANCGHLNIPFLNSTNLFCPFHTGTLRSCMGMNFNNLPIDFLQYNPFLIQPIINPNVLSLFASPKNNFTNNEIDNKEPENNLNEFCKGNKIINEKDALKSNAEAMKENLCKRAFSSDIELNFIKNGEMYKEYGFQVNEKEIAHSINNDKIFNCKFCDFKSTDKRSLGGHVSKNHPKLSLNYTNIQVRRNSLKRIRARTKLLLAKIEYFNKTKGLSNLDSNVPEITHYIQKGPINRALFRQIKDDITEDMISNYLHNQNKN